MSSDAPTTKAKQRIWLDHLIADLTNVRGRLLTLRMQLHNRPPVKRAPNGATKITAEMRRRVREIATAHPDLTNHEIAILAELPNDGRVSEILAGKRT